jgi:hypothetical protein
MFNHAPELKGWTRTEARPSEIVRGIVALYMGDGFPVETIEWSILAAMEQFAHLGVEAGMNAYLDTVGRDGQVLLAAIRRNFKRHPERWRGAVN